MAPFTGQVNTSAAGRWLTSGEVVSSGTWEGWADGVDEGAILGAGLALTAGEDEGRALGDALAVIWGIWVLPATASAGSSPVPRMERMRK